MRVDTVKKTLKYLFGLLFALMLLFGVLRLLAAPSPDYPYFKPYKFLVIAHRGGRSLGPENTLYTFKRAADLGVDVLEMDVHRTKDGKLVVLHDSTVDRTTNGTGTVDRYTLTELKKLDAAYYWSPDQGKSFPLRGRGISIPALSEVFEAFPQMRMNIEIKEPGQSELSAFCRLIHDSGMTQKVLIASFDAGALKKFRSLCPGIATSAGASEVMLFYALQKLHLESVYSPAFQALQVPLTYDGLQVVTKRFVDAAHARNLKVHVWTINGVVEMQKLMRLGVDGIMTDYPQLLLELIAKKKQDLKSWRSIVEALN
jgi:glycerophosphoryl diester phosphodiesterase